MYHLQMEDTLKNSYYINGRNRESHASMISKSCLLNQTYKWLNQVKKLTNNLTITDWLL